MDAQPIGGKSATHDAGDTAGQEARMLQARLDILVASLSASVWMNPSLTLIWMLPFLGLFPRLGTVTWAEFTVVMVMQFAISVGARVIRRGYARDPSDPWRWFKRLVVYQSAAGVGWGVFAWLIWVDGNALNNVLVSMTMCGIIWAYAFSRCMHVGIYFAGVSPTALLTIARIADTGGDLAVPLSLIVAITVALVYFFTFFVRRQVEVMLRMRFANDDLAVELRETRDDALRKRFEAEAANASKTTFLANMSHELRTPLNAILGFSELISSETLGPVGTARYRDYANDINSSGTHLLSLINDILDIAKIESGKMEILPTALEPRAALDSAMNVILGRAREKQHTVSVHIAPGMEELYSDERAFRQIVINLLSNAVKFTPDGGKIDVALRRTANGGAELCVSDNGPGIPAMLLEQIFMPFNQVDNRYSRQAGGTGLGLSLVRGLAELHGGRAWIDSDAGRGVKAYVYLPGDPRETVKLRRA
ncbi:MAG TPA: ATP-binding protein [Rhizomicrobium sp.]|nr:ATP-binding protein [Rhizomicrobium sp.]